MNKHTSPYTVSAIEKSESAMEISESASPFNEGSAKRMFSA